MTYTCPCGGVCACHAGSAAFPPPCDLPGGCGSTTPPDRPSGATPRPDAPPPASGAHADARGEPERREPADLAAVVAQLVRPTSAEVTLEGRDPRDGSVLVQRTHVPVRPLLAELRAELVPGGESGGAGRGGGAPVSVEVLDALGALHRHVSDTLRKLGLRQRQHARECSSCSTPVRHCRHGLDRHGRPLLGPYGAPCCSRHRHPPAPDRIADGLAQLVAHPWPNPAARQAFADHLRALVEHAGKVLDGTTSSTYVRDTRCPRCHAWTVREPGPAGPSGRPTLGDPHPALRVNRGRPADDGRPGPIRGTSCTGCGRRWTWADMQGPTSTESAGRLWHLLRADADLLDGIRRRRRVAERLAEAGRRERLYGDDDAEAEAARLGLPSAPATEPRTAPATRTAPELPEPEQRPDTLAIRRAAEQAQRRTTA